MSEGSFKLGFTQSSAAGFLFYEGSYFRYRLCNSHIHLRTLFFIFVFSYHNAKENKT